MFGVGDGGKGCDSLAQSCTGGVVGACHRRQGWSARQGRAVVCSGSALAPAAARSPPGSITITFLLEPPAAVVITSAFVAGGLFGDLETTPLALTTAGGKLVWRVAITQPANRSSHYAFFMPLRPGIPPNWFDQEPLRGMPCAGDSRHLANARELAWGSEDVEVRACWGQCGDSSLCSPSPPAAAPRPTAPQSLPAAGGSTHSPGIFCFILVMQTEVAQMRTVLDIGGTDSLAGCGAWRVYSNVTRLPTVSDHPLCHSCVEKAVHGSMQVAYGGLYNSAWNTKIFQQVWSHVLLSGAYRGWRWTVKTEVDVVFRASRLTEFLLAYNHEEAVLGVEEDGFSHGPVQVLSAAAMRRWSDGEFDHCVRATPPYDGSANFWEQQHSLLEDFWLFGCTGYVASIQHRSMPRLLRDVPANVPSNVGGALDIAHDCSGSFATVHKVMTREDWKQCFARMPAPSG